MYNDTISIVLEYLVSDRNALTYEYIKMLLKYYRNGPVMYCPSNARRLHSLMTNICECNTIYCPFSF